MSYNTSERRQEAVFVYVTNMLCKAIRGNRVCWGCVEGALKGVLRVL